MAQIFASSATTAANNFEGKRIRGDASDPVYLVLDGKLCHIANPAVYEALFGTSSITFETVPQQMVDNFPKGAQLNRRTPLVKGFDDPVYLIDQDKKRWLSSPDVFNRYKFSWDKIVKIGDVVDLVATGPKIS